MRIRLAPELKDKIQEAAHANGRSMNAEISLRLEKSFENDEDQRKVWVGISEVKPSEYAGDAGMSTAELLAQMVQEGERLRLHIGVLLEELEGVELEKKGAAIDSATKSQKGKLKGGRKIDLD